MDNETLNLLDYLDTTPEPEPAPGVGSVGEPVALSGPDNASDLSVEDKFWRWLIANPAVYDEIIRRCEIAVGLNRTRLSMKQLFEAIRWDFSVTHGDVDGYRLNNNYTSLMVRLLQVRRPDLAAMFETRERRNTA